MLPPLWLVTLLNPAVHGSSEEPNLEFIFLRPSTDTFRIFRIATGISKYCHDFRVIRGSKSPTRTGAAEVWVWSGRMEILLLQLVSDKNEDVFFLGVGAPYAFKGFSADPDENVDVFFPFFQGTKSETTERQRQVATDLVAAADRLVALGPQILEGACLLQFHFFLCACCSGCSCGAFIAFVFLLQVNNLMSNAFEHSSTRRQARVGVASVYKTSANFCSIGREKGGVAVLLILLMIPVQQRKQLVSCQSMWLYLR